MRIVEFSKKQPEVHINHVNGDRWFYIALHEAEVNQHVENSDVNMTLYQYDYNDFMDNSIDQDDVQNNPEKYLNYVTKIEVSDAYASEDNDRITALEENQQVIIEALAEIIGG